MSSWLTATVLKVPTCYVLNAPSGLGSIRVWCIGGGLRQRWHEFLALWVIVMHCV